MLSAREYIILKQVQWAKNRGIDLIGSKGERGRRAYTPTLEQNLFMPLSEDAKESFGRGNGNEIVGEPNRPAKMQAVHSSSAIGVNVFQYWAEIHQVPVIAAACGFCKAGNTSPEKIVFEDKYPVKGVKRIPPNIDVVIHNSENSRYKRFAIECKFSEAYGSRHKNGIKRAYLDVEELWEDIPALHKLARKLCPENKKYKHLDAAQLIKHTLGLKSAFGKQGFKLLYLRYDVLGKEGADHREEIDAFTEIAKADGVRFMSLSYQELIVRLVDGNWQTHEEYVKYLTGRYL